MPLIRRLAPLVPLAAALALALPAAAQTQAPSSDMDAPLFYQLLMGELQLQAGEPAVAFQLLLDAARRTADEALFRRAAGVALQARDGQSALQALKAWRAAHPRSMEAIQTQLQLQGALGRGEEMPAGILDWLQGSTDAPSRMQQLQALPRLLRQGNAMDSFEPGLARERDNAANPAERRALAACTIAQLALLDRNGVLALNQLRQARQLDPQQALPHWLALDLLRLNPAAEDLLLPTPDPAYQLAHARTLARDQRSAEALALFQQLQKSQPEEPAHSMAIGALLLDLRRPAEAETALRQHLSQLAQQPAGPARESTHAGAHLLLAQALEQQKNFSGAQAALDAVQDEQRAFELAYRRAALLARQGQLEPARAMVRALPGEGQDIARRRLLAEAQILRDAGQWANSHQILQQALAAEPDNTDLLYESAMSAERLKQHDQMEQLLRRVIELDPRHHHARNALGYSLADRNLRLPEARELLEAAIELGGHEPALVDSLGWLAFREGQLEEAEQLLRRAHRARPEVEIGAHLAEVLWARGQQDEARALLQQAASQDADNEVLRDTRRRLGLK
ncbi:Flp pilus assembly protein TadD [Inhella inkyongensis]|uniref:Flp pilus assembly protein TadD n=1 Tax=Inhella inkyongensis TaxID=392593 RepID=A0A840S731_9BURK|nr:tetratricopeptide repeat protein [Inhella inkyongensis]MBB5204594.1 Flp pilus assembly protein TadD [Inhella inkyongensis]